jgi:hypothetical protein
VLLELMIHNAHIFENKVIMKKVQLSRYIFKTADGCLILDKDLGEVQSWYEEDILLPILNSHAREKGVRIISRETTKNTVLCIVQYL